MWLLSLLYYAPVFHRQRVILVYQAFLHFYGEMLKLEVLSSTDSFERSYTSLVNKING